MFVLIRDVNCKLYLFFSVKIDVLVASEISLMGLVGCVMELNSAELFLSASETILK